MFLQRQKLYVHWIMFQKVSYAFTDTKPFHSHDMQTSFRGAACSDLFQSFFDLIFFLLLKSFPYNLKIIFDKYGALCPCVVFATFIWITQCNLKTIKRYKHFWHFSAFCNFLIVPCASTCTSIRLVFVNLPSGPK